MKPICFFLLLLVAAASAADIPLGSTLSAADPNARWNSPNNTFSVSFIADSSGTLIAAVNYNNDYPIWQAGASANSSSVLRLHTSGDLQLLPTPTSETPIWSSGTSNLGVAAASLEDTGNFVLKNSSGAAVWSTFDHPTDTIVPTQTFHPSQTLSSGLYSFRIRSNGNLTLLWNNTITYYNSGLNSSSNSNLTNPYIEIQGTGVVVLSDPTFPSSRILAYSSDYSGEGNIMRFLKLDSDGNLKIYSFSGGSSSSRIIGWAAVSDQCQVYGYCGNMGVCSYNNTNPICECPSQNFDLIDPNDSRKGCRRKTQLQDCLSTETMLELDHSLFLTFPPDLSSQVFYQGTAACRLNCLTSPVCNASTSLADGSGLCYFKMSGFTSYYRSPALPSSSYVKVCPPALPNPAPDSASNKNGRKWKLTVWVVALVVFITLTGLVVFEGGLWWFCFKNNPKFGGLSAQYALLEYASGAPVQFSYKELHKSTKGFKEKLGAGGFGVVYRGVLGNRTTAAVKQLEGIEQGEKQFRMEVATISSTHHLNLVRLIGFCSEGRHRLLVYEFMKNGSLDNFLFANNQSEKVLNWECRFDIALGTARGITYLHEECRDCIVHCDIKPENILLDENFHAKVSDFGLAKLVNSKDHRYRTLTSVRGTRGYLAPEWLANLPITSKSDVYSYGMVLLEILSGKRNFEVSAETNQKKFSLWAYEEFEKGNFEGVLDRRLKESDEEVDMEQVKRALEVSFWCIQEQPSQRPMMGKVVHMLEGILVIEPPPAPKAVRDGSMGGTSGTGSAVSVFSTSSVSRKHLERGSSSLVESSEVL